MNKSLLRKFCESPRRKLIVVIATVVIGLVVLVPMVDEYFDIRENYMTLADELDFSRETVASLPSLESQVLKVSGELKSLEDRTVTGQNVSQYRSRLVGLIRDADCKVRRLEVSQPTRRPWLENDNPRLQKIPPGTTVTKTPFSLEKRSVTLLVDGTMENIQELMKQLNEDHSFAYPNRLKLHTNNRRRGVVTLEMEMWLFALGRQAAI